MGQLLAPSSSASSHAPSCYLWIWRWDLPGGVQRVITSLSITSNCLQREHDWKGGAFFVRITAPVMHKQAKPRLIVGGTLISHCIQKSTHSCNKQASLPHTSITSSLGEQRLTWLVSLGEGSRHPWHGCFLFFSFFLPAYKKHSSTTQCCRSRVVFMFSIFFFWGGLHGEASRLSALCVTR